MLDGLPGGAKKTVGADKNYDTAAFVTAREMNAPGASGLSTLNAAA